MAKPGLSFVLHLIGREDGAGFLDQSQSKIKINESNPGLLSTVWFM